MKNFKILNWLNSTGFKMLLCLSFIGCENSIEREEPDKNRSNPKSLLKNVNEIIKPINHLTDFNNWEYIPVHIIAENNKFLTAKNSNQELVLMQKDNNERQTFYIKPYDNGGGLSSVQLFSYPKGQTDKYGISAGIPPYFSSITNPIDWKLRFTSTVNPNIITKWRLWNVNLNGDKSNFLMEANSLGSDLYSSSTGFPTHSVLTAKNDLFDNKLYFENYDKNSVQRFQIIPEEEFDIININFDINNQITTQMPDFVSHSTLINNTSIQQSSTMTFQNKAITTSSWEVGGSVTASVAYEKTLGLPGIASGKFSVSSSVSVSGKYGKSETKEDWRVYEFPVVAPPHSTVKGSATIKQYKGDISYTMFAKGKSSGKIITVNGIWKGVGVGQIFYKVDEIASKNGTILKY